MIDIVDGSAFWRSTASPAGAAPAIRRHPQMGHHTIRRHHPGGTETPVAKWIELAGVILALLGGGVWRPW